MAADVLSVTRQEANTALLELFKGLRSPRPGEQCEAIVKFPSLMNKFQFPIISNVAFLKLAEIFRTGSNLLRFNILKVVQISQKHINKITSVEEFVKRIHSVVHSNDPIARAITLRLFAATSSLVCDKKTVHHSIQSSLESHDQIEVEAAIFATNALCELSSVFAEGVYVKIADMVLGLKTSPDMKLRAIPVFRKMHHSLEIASKVREVCLKVLENYPNLTFVSVVMPTLTELAIATLVQAPEQVELLLHYVKVDVRKAVRHFCLLGLHKLSIKTPQCWKKASIEKLISLVERSEVISEQEIGCCILYQLSTTITIQHMIPLEESIKPFCYGLISPVIRAYSTACCSNILRSSYPTGFHSLVPESKESVMADQGQGVPMEVEEDNKIEWNEIKAKNLLLVAVDILVTEDFQGKSSKSIKALLGSIGNIADKIAVQEDVIVALVSQLHKLHGDCYPVLCSTISVMAAAERNWQEGERVGGELVSQHLLQTLQNRDYSSLLLPVAHMLLELHSGVYSSGRYMVFVNTVEPLLLSRLWESIDKGRFWIAYRIALKATKRGFHKMSGKIYQILHEKVTNFKFKSWFETLELFSDAQCAIADAEGDPSQLVLGLQTASSHLYTCALLVMGASPPSSLPSQFLPALGGLINLYSWLLSLCIRYRTFLSPSITGGDAPIPKFKKIAAEFRDSSKLFSSLLNSLFDADSHTLLYIKLLQQSCDLMSNIISAFTSPEKPLLSPVRSVSTPILPSTGPISLETTDSFDTSHTLGVVCNRLLSVAQSNGLRLQSLPFSHEHLTAIENSVLSLLDVPFLLPPLYFSSYQSTSVQLALSPQPTAKPVSVILGNHLALDVEGVIKHYGNRIFRSPSSVVVSVKPQVDKLADMSMKVPTLQDLEEIPVVKNDYYIAQFLLTLPTAGQYVLKIDNNLVDHEGKIWHTGPSVEMKVVVDVEEKLDSSGSGGPRPSTTAAGSTTNNGDTSTSSTKNTTTTAHKQQQW